VSTGDATASDEAGGGDAGRWEIGYGTNTPRYRWKALSTLVAVFLVLYYPAVVFLSLAGEISSPGTATSSVLVLSWLSGIGYSIGTDILRDVREIRGGGGGSRES